MKTIGIVAEGPRDFELIAAVIDTITNAENSYQMIQPEPDMAGRFGNGWKGVWKWCETNQGTPTPLPPTSVKVLRTMAQRTTSLLIPSTARATSPPRPTPSPPRWPRAAMI